MIRHPAVALFLAVGWLAFCGVCVLARQAFSEPAQRRLEQAGNAADRAAGWWLSGYGRRYRQWVLDSNRYIDVKGLATGGDHTPELDAVYVDVALVRRSPHQVSGNPLSSVPEDVAGRYSVSEFLDGREPVVLAVSGPPGSGKSTLLAHAARRSAESRQRNRRNVPIFLVLREHARTITANPAVSLPDVLRGALAGVPGKEPEGWWERQLSRGKCTILFDGLDEVAGEKDRSVITRWLERQINIYPGNHFVITSRPYGLPGPVIAQANILAVRPFTVEQVRLFLNRWCLAAERHSTGAASKSAVRAVRILADEEAARLFALLRANSALYDLTVNPLLLTLIATVHRYRGALPGSRPDLYDEICQVMLSRRIQAKNLTEVLPWPVKQKLLTALAYDMMLKRVSELPARQVMDILDPLLRRQPQPITAQSFLEDISRNGLLLQAAPDRYAFTHLTFQEYLAARHVSANPDLVKTLVRSVDDQWWRETSVLYAAIADADQIVSACLDRATMPALSLAFDCAEISSGLSLDLRQRLDLVRDQVYERDSDPVHRRLIASVLATSLARQTTTTSAGTRICTRPVPADLYWMFLEDTASLQPDNACEPGPDRLVTGVQGREAIAFVKWLNMLTADSIQGEFRLPHDSELRELTGGGAGQLRDPVTSVWTQPLHEDAVPGLWIPPGRVDPHLVSGDTIRQAIVSDAGNTKILNQIFIATTFNTAYRLHENLNPARDLALNRTDNEVRRFARDLRAASVRGLAKSTTCDIADSVSRDLGRALFFLEMRNKAHALEAAVADALFFGRASDFESIRSLARGLHLDSDAGRELDPGISDALDLDLTRVSGLYRDLDHARSSDRFRNRDLGLRVEDMGYLARELGVDCASNLARDLHRALRFVLTRARNHAHDLTLDLGRDLGIESGVDRKAILLGSFAVPLTWIDQGPFRRISQRVLAGDSSSSAARSIFADELIWGAGVESTTQIKASLDDSVLRRLQSIAGVKPVRLDEAVSFLLTQRQHPQMPEAAAIRTIALALAEDSLRKRDDNATQVYREVAATATLLQLRYQGKAKIGEAVILALS